MTQVKQGDKVRIDYTGTLDDGTVFDSTYKEEGSDECGDDCECGNDCDCESGDCEDDDCGCGGDETGPIDMTIGEEDFFPQFDEALVGMKIGDVKTINIPAAEAFGEYEKDKVFTVPRSDMPEDLQPEEGDELVLTNEDDEELGVVVVGVTEESITFDSNHPLAGEDLKFEITLREIL